MVTGLPPPTGVAVTAKPVIFACNGAECWKSYKSCVAAVNAGYQQVFWFRGGFPEWVARGYPVESVPANVAIARSAGRPTVSTRAAATSRAGRRGRGRRR